MILNCQQLSSYFIDTDECINSTSNCAQICINEVGSYSCSCDTGYQLLNDNYGCADIDECAQSIDGCVYTCTNTIGNYTCSCDSGYYLASDGHTCNGEFFLMQHNIITMKSPKKASNKCCGT